MSSLTLMMLKNDYINSNNQNGMSTRQEVELINKGLKGEFNASIAKLMLANHGYSEKQTLDHQSMGNSIIAKSKPMRIELVSPPSKDLTA